MLDWDDLRYFLALARHGNLSLAARELRVAQSTLGRRLASLESSLGARLLNRTPDGYVATPAGEAVLKKVELVEIETLALERDIGGRDKQMIGRIHITCPETVASHIISPILADFHRIQPDIILELIPDHRELSLSMRMADISVRLRQSKQHDLVIRRIATLAFALYASPKYLAEHGTLNFKDGCANHFLITQRDDLQDEQITWLARIAPHARTAIETSSHEAAVSAALEGGGLVCLARFRADREAGLVRLDTPSSAPDTGLWLVTPKDNRTNPRIRAILAHITDQVRRATSQFKPGDLPSQTSDADRES